MKQNTVKQMAVVTLSCALFMTAVGCGNGNSTSIAESTATPTSQIEEGSSNTENLYENLQLGMGVVVTSKTDASAQDGMASTSGTVSHIAVSVLLEDGVIRGSMLDEHESAIETLEGGLALPNEVQSKREKGDAYGLRSYSGIGKEWYEQADAFCNYIQGMTCEEVMAIPVDEAGKPTESDLAAGCTIAISEFQKAIENACNNAKDITDMDMEDYTNYKNETTGTDMWDDLVDGAEDVLDGVEDGVDDVLNGVEDGTNAITNDMGGANQASY